MSNVRRVYSHGVNSLNNAKITSNLGGNINTTMTVIINEDNGKSFTIECSQNNSCYIKCVSDNSCSKLSLYCYGECFVFCKTNCPNAIVGNYTEWDTFAPTNIPTITPISIPTKVPFESAHTGKSTQEKLVIQLESITTYTLFGIFMIAAILTVGAFYHYYYLLKPAKKLIDKPNIYCIFKCAHNFADLWTDILFAVILYLQKDSIINSTYKNLWAFAIIFVFVPFFVQCVLSLWYLDKWQQRMNKIIKTDKTYPSSHDSLLIVCSIIFGFYSAMELMRSKLFYQTFFHSQLSNRYYKQIRCYRFLNIVILENIPQLIIQFLYILNVDSDTTNIIVYLSMLLSFLSIMVQFATHLSYMLSARRNSQLGSNKCKCKCKCDAAKNTRFKHEHKIKVEMNIQHTNLRLIHYFCNRTIEEIMSTYLINFGGLKLSQRSIDDFKYYVETMYVDSKQCNKGRLTIYFQIFISTDDDQLTENIRQSIRHVETKRQHPNGKEMEKLIKNSFHLDKKKSANIPTTLEISSLKIYDQKTDEEILVDVGKHQSAHSNIVNPMVPPNININQRYSQIKPEDLVAHFNYVASQQQRLPNNGSPVEPGARSQVLLSNDLDTKPIE